MGGHLCQRGSSWELVAYAGRDPLSGRRKYGSRTFKGPKREAQAPLDRLVVEVEDGHEGGSGSTVGELLDSWIARPCAPARTPASEGTLVGCSAPMTSVEQ